LSYLAVATATATWQHWSSLPEIVSGESISGLFKSLKIWKIFLGDGGNWKLQERM
jgi:hypothetical protein